MRTRVWKWGNGLAVRIPTAVPEQAGLGPSAEVEVSFENGELRIAPVHAGWRLDQLLSKVTKRNLQAEQQL
jgi:antitoxin component of MazEF toxin-antitoxin module